MARWLPRTLDALIVSALVALLALAFLWLPGLAQYPPPVGVVRGAVATPNPPAGSSTTLTCEVRDPAGNPVADEPCTFTIVEEPGTDASLGSKSVTKRTNEQGIATATLYTGTTPGVIVVRIEARGVATQVTVHVQAAGPMLPPTLAEPPAAMDTARSLLGESGQIAILAALAALVVGLGLVRVRMIRSRPRA